MADKKYSVILEKVGNQPLMTTKILCGELGLGLAKAKGLVDKVPSTIATDLESAKALELKKKLEEAGNTVSIPGLKIEAEPTAKKNVKSSAVSSDDAFAAIFGGSTTPKTTTVKKQSTSGTTPKTTVVKAEPKKTTSKAPAASSDSFDSLFGGAAPKKETKTQPKASVAKTMRKEYSNGSYEGEMKDGEPHGFGTYRWNDGDIYTGEYVNGVRHGKGKFVFASGNYYDGEWANGKYHGHGIFRWSDGDEFDGEWQNGQRHGKGKWTYGDGRYYTGVWENGESISSSSIVYPSSSGNTAYASIAKVERVVFDNGDVYEGEMVDGFRHGKGKYTWANGNEYEGDWVRGKRTGYGVYKSYDKNEIKGGTFVSYIYEGEWKNSEKHGRGVAKGYEVFHHFGHVYMDWSYDGEWVADNRHGKGAYWEWGGDALHEAWRVYRGEWIDNVRQGLFVWNYEPYGTGKKYINYYVDGKDVVWGAPYSPSIKTLEDAKRAKEREESNNRFTTFGRRTRKENLSNSLNARKATSEYVTDCSNKAMQAYKNRDYFRCAYYLHSGGLSGDDFYRDVIGMCYHPSGATGYAYVENILTGRSLGDLPLEEVHMCAFILDKFIPNGTGESKTYRAWCYYRDDEMKKAAGLISNRGLMFYNGRIQDILEVMGGKPFSKSTPYSDEIMARRYLDKVIDNLMMYAKGDPESYLRGDKYLQNKVALAEAYISFAKRERRQYRVPELEKDLRALKELLK